MFLERKFISSSLTHCRACVRTTCTRTKAAHRISDTLLRFHGWLLGLAEVQRVPQRSHDHGPHYHPVHTPMPMLPSYESTKNVLIETHSFTCASYKPFESLHIDNIGPLPVDDKGNSHILVMIDAFSRWVELFPTKTTGASEAAACIF